MLKNALISIVVFIFLDFDGLLCSALPFACTFHSPLPTTNTLFLTLSFSVIIVIRSFIRFNSHHYSLSLSLSSCHSFTLLSLLLFISLLCELVSINLLSEFFFSQLRNVIEPIAWKSFKSEIVFKKHFAVSFFVSLLLLFEIHRPKIHSILPTSYFKIQ